MNYKNSKRTAVIKAASFTLLLGIGHNSLLAQDGFTAAGGVAEGYNGKVSYSVGQPFYIEATSQGGGVSQGVQQPDTYGVLPITLLELTATPVNNAQVLVQWQTAREINNNFFTVEKSRNGIAFEEAARVKGAGNSNTIKQYSFKDVNPYSGISYYRIKQTDIDNAFVYSGIKIVKINPVLSSIKIFPNPVDKYLTVQVGAVGKETLAYKVYDLSGRLLKSNTITSTETTIDMSALAPATYTIQFTNGNTTTPFKLIKN